jgi:hypothetical protein
MVSDITKRWDVTIDSSGIAKRLDSHSVSIYSLFFRRIRVYASFIVLQV